MPSTRRSVLRSAAGLSSLAVAGCQSLSGDQEATEIPRTDPVTDYAVATLRRSDGTPYRYDGNGDGDDHPLVLGSSDTLDAITVTSSDQQARRFESFLGETDFERRAVLLYRRRIPECEAVDVESVWRRSGSLSVTLCRERLPADEQCSTDARIGLGIAIRVPFTSDQFDRPTTSISSECTARLGPRETAEEQ